VLELPNKIAMSREDYFIAQQIYRGWDRLAYVLGAHLTAMIAVLPARPSTEPGCSRGSFGRPVGVLGLDLSDER
jgi:hypothetical protein